MLHDLGDAAFEYATLLAQKLRAAGKRAYLDFDARSLKSQMRLADKFDSKYTLLLGKMEVKEGTIILRDMQAGKQKQIPFDEALPTIVKLLGEKNLDTYSLKYYLGENDED